jgi:hypothetical protein
VSRELSFGWCWSNLAPTLHKIYKNIVSSGNLVHRTRNWYTTFIHASTTFMYIFFDLVNIYRNKKSGTIRYNIGTPNGVISLRTNTELYALLVQMTALVQAKSLDTASCNMSSLLRFKSWVLTLKPVGPALWSSFSPPSSSPYLQLKVTHVHTTLTTCETLQPCGAWWRERNLTDESQQRLYADWFRKYPLPSCDQLLTNLLHALERFFSSY